MKYPCYLCGEKQTWNSLMPSENPKTHRERSPDNYREAMVEMQVQKIARLALDETASGSGVPPGESPKGGGKGASGTGIPPDAPDAKKGDTDDPASKRSKKSGGRWKRNKADEETWEIVSSSAVYATEGNKVPDIPEHTGKNVRYMKVCVKCELQWRLENRGVYRDVSWSTEIQVKKDCKFFVKGNSWGARAEAWGKSIDMLKAEKELKPFTKAEADAFVKSNCKKLAKELLGVIQNGVLFKAFESAGRRFKIHGETLAKVDEAFEAYQKDPTEEKYQALEQLEEKYAEGLEYQTAGGNPEVLKALDYENAVPGEQNFACFDICRSSNGCGYYMPGVYWTQSERRWQFYCKVDWEKACANKNGGAAVLKEMTKLHGPNKQLWPDIGCGAKFRPWCRGASKILEIKTDEGWVNIIAERLPEQLDDAIKDLQHQWHAACQRLEPDDILAFVNLIVPKLNQVPHAYGVAQYNIARWKSLGSPTLTAAGWMALCRAISMKDPNLNRILTICVAAPEPGEPLCTPA